MAPGRRNSASSIAAPATGAAKRDKGTWQRRYWEHAIRDDGDPSCRCALLFDH
jgi:putative transposase